MIVLSCTPIYSSGPYFHINIKDSCLSWVITSNNLNYLETIEYKCMRKIVREKYRVFDTTCYEVSILIDYGDD
jgi:hypothetical protein